VRVYQFRHIRGGIKCSRVGTILDLKRGLILICGLAAALAASGPAAAQAPRTEVVVTLDAPPLAQAISQSRALTKAARTRRLDLRTPTSLGYLRGLAAAQRTLQSRIANVLPAATVRWHYSIVLDALAVDLPSAQVKRLSRLPGVARVYPSVRYHALGETAPTLNQTPALIGAPTLWGPSLATAGNGMKIGIVDDGVNQSHPFFSPSGFTMPAGFPKGNTSFTTAKVIVARAFPPPSPKYANANLPFDPDESEHATHVAGIAAGDHGTPASGGLTVSGIAPKAYLGNYKVLTIPTISGVGLDGNSPEIAKGIEAAVADGMDVINLSLGEPEIEISRDIVVKAIDGAAAAGVVPAIAAGNDFDGFGRGSIGSPGSAPRAITAAAATKSRVIATFSSGGPTPVSLQMKPDVTAPGVSVLSSVPARDGLWEHFSGTSMASPHVAGGSALLRQQHPTWTVAQIKSALVLTGTPVYTSASHAAEATPAREGGGFIDLPAADEPLIFAAPTGLSFGLLKSGSNAARTISLTDAGSGAGQWQVSIEQRQGPAGSVTAPGTVGVPGTLEVSAHAPAGQQSEVTGFVVLTRGSESRRLPFWFRIESPQLPRQRHGTLKKNGTYKGNTRGRPSLVDTYRYPDNPSGIGIPADLGGPEQVFTVQLKKPVANFGVAVLSQGSGVAIQPRVVAGNDENRLTGYPALPLNLNPYVPDFYELTPVAGAILPTAGRYDVVFDSTSSLDAGKFTFRFWINDVTRPAVKLLTRTVKQNKALQIRVTDAGSGVHPSSLFVALDRMSVRSSYSPVKHRVTVPLRGLTRGSHTLVLQVSDYQETRNMEDVGPILPNTRTLTTKFRVK
jgi:subtilisin family serine protease